MLAVDSHGQQYYGWFPSFSYHSESWSLHDNFHAPAVDTYHVLATRKSQVLTVTENYMGSSREGTVGQVLYLDNDGVYKKLYMK